MIKKIISKEPLTEFYICGKLPRKDIKVLNEAIKNGLSNVCENLMK